MVGCEYPCEGDFLNSAFVYNFSLGTLFWFKIHCKLNVLEIAISFIAIFNSSDSQINYNLMHDNQWSGMEFDFLKQLKSKCSLYSIMSNDPFCDIDLKILVD